MSLDLHPRPTGRRDHGGSDFADLRRRIDGAGLLDRRPGYYALRAALLGTGLVGGWTAFVVIGQSAWQLVTAVVLAVVSFAGVWLIRGDWEVAANLLAQASQDAIASHIFGVVPLFVLTGFLVAIADVGKDAFEVANQVLRRLRGRVHVCVVEDDCGRLAA